jgi:hypothetical protein
VISVHEIGREGWTDERQLVRAATERRCVVTGNGRDFERLTRLFYAEDRPHAGVLIVQGALRYADPAAVAQALLQFDQTRGRFPMEHACEYYTQLKQTTSGSRCISLRLTKEEHTAW